ncbi:MAG: prepilin-type N-terminal cleavage/methylation domain-containing protein [Bacillota bacterium]
MNKKNYGFTLIELVLVMAIIFTLFAVSFPNFLKILAGYQLRGAANQLVADMRWVRQESIYGSAGVIKINFAKNNTYYAIEEGTKRRVKRDLPKGITFLQVPLTNSQLTFSLIGAPSQAGTIILKNSYNDFCYIYLMPSTGRIRMAFEDQEEE